MCSVVALQYRVGVTDSTQSMFTDPEAMRERVARQMEEAHERAANAAALTERLKQIHVDVDSKRREVSLQVNASGLLTDLKFGPAATELSLEAIASLVLETYQNAQRQAAQQAVALTEEAMGEDIAGRMRSDYESRLGAIGDDSSDDDQQYGMRGMLWNR